MDRKWQNVSSTVTNQTPSCCTVNSVSSQDTFQNIQGPSEYSAAEIVSLASLSDTDEELQTIENKVYVDGDEGKEEAYKDIEQVFDQLESEKLLDPFTGRISWRPPEASSNRYQRPFVPKRPTALSRENSNRSLDSGKEETENGRKVSLRKSIESTKASSTAVGKASIMTVGTSSHLSISQNTPNSKTKLSKSSKNKESLSSPRKAVMVELIMDAVAEENIKKKREEVAQKKKEIEQDLKKKSQVNKFGEHKVVTENVNAFGVNRSDSLPSTNGENDEPEDPLNPKLTRQEELIQELAVQGSKKDKNEICTLDKDGKKGEEGDKTLFKIQYKEPRWPHQVTLDKMVGRLYRVKTLILDESEISSLRDISSLLPSLIVLSVKSCGLTTLDGTLAFPNLHKLYASDNKLTHAAQCSLLTELQELDLSGNPIESFEGFDYLSVLKCLRILKLYDTKISVERNFHMELRRLIPSVRNIYPKIKSHSQDWELNDEKFLEEDYKLLGKALDNFPEGVQEDGKTTEGTSKSKSLTIRSGNLTDQSPTTIEEMAKDLLRQKMLISSVEGSDSETEHTNKNENLEYLYQYMSAAGKSDADSVRTTTATNVKPISANEFDMNSIKCNSSHWSTLEGEFDPENDIDDPHLDDAGDKLI